MRSLGVQPLAGPGALRSVQAKQCNGRIISYTPS